MNLEAVSAFLSRGGTVTKCARGAFGLKENAPNKAYQYRGGAATARNRSNHTVHAPGPELGRRIRAVRERRGMTMEAVGTELRKSWKWVSHMEQGRLQLSSHRSDARRTVAAVERWLAKWEAR